MMVLLLRGSSIPCMHALSHIWPSAPPLGNASKLQQIGEVTNYRQPIVFVLRSWCTEVSNLSSRALAAQNSAVWRDRAYIHGRHTTPTTT